MYLPYLWDTESKSYKPIAGVRPMCLTKAIVIRSNYNRGGYCCILQPV